MHEGQTQATNNGNVPRGSTTLSGAPNWLAAESVSARQMPAASLLAENARAVPMSDN
jgi:hypothetical protein